MSNLDQFFKDKFQDREFEFQESYWEGARDLIEEDDKRRRRAFWWRNLGLGFLLLTIISAGAGIYWWTSDNDPVAATSENTSITETTRPTETTAKTPERKTILGENFGEASETSPIDPSLESGQSTETDTESSSANLKFETPNSKFKITQNKNHKRDKRTQKTYTENGPNSKQEPQKGQKATKDIHESTSQLKTTSFSPPTPKGESTLLNKITLARPNSKLNNPKLKTQQLSNSPIAQLPPASTTDHATSPMDRLAPISEFAPLSLLPLHPLPVVDDPLSTTIRYSEQEKQKWTLGFTAWSQFYPSGDQASLWSGGAIGPTLGYALNEQWQLQADLLYQIRRGNFSSIGESSNKTYTFGLREIQNLLHPTTAHYLELPVYLQWHNRRQIIEGGLFISYLTGLRGEREERTYLQPWELTPKPFANCCVESEIVEKGWVESTALSQLRPGFLMGYRYRMAASLTANFQVKYYLNNIASDPNMELVQESGPIQIRLGLTYYPFRSLRK